ncbi:MAG: 3'-5' exonuclease, partial [Hydrogenophaga sp.]|nr:3'-5' exonuclease [Hydrogenophaga sp.]
YAWIKMLAGQGDEARAGADALPGGSVIAVGDDDQSIYAFRGARVGNMADFVREFRVRHQIKLERNYRSFGNILDSANALISHNSKRLGKNLRTEAGPGEPVRVYEATSDFAEAQWFVDEVRQLVRDGMARKEIALLYRSNAQSRVMETALFNNGIAYRVYGGLRFFERAEIKHALAYLRLLENPHDDTSFMRVVNFPPRGIGARSIEQLQDVARTSGCSLHDAVSAVTGRAGVAIGAFVAKLDVLRERSEGMTLSEIIELVLDHSGLVEHYRAEREGQDRVENLEELVSAAKSFVGIEGFGRDAVARTADGSALTQSPVSQGLEPGEPSPQPSSRGRGSDAGPGLLPLPLGEGGGEGLPAPDLETGETMSPLAAFLTHAALESGDNQAQAGQDAVQLMTVHAAKGLEFDVVFITGMEEGLFPHENAMNDRDGLEEERRLMYVAITRARKRLYLSHSQTRMLHGQTRYNMPSRFFDELPAACLKWLTPQQAGWGAGGGAGMAGGTGAWHNGQRSLGAAPVLQPSWSPGFAERGDPKGLGQSAPEPDRQTGVKAGQKVFHNKFGEGKVLSIEGAGADARAQVSFSRHGVKWLALSVAKLTPVDD